jgi:hypothetical protein
MELLSGLGDLDRRHIVAVSYDNGTTRAHKVMRVAASRTVECCLHHGGPDYPIWALNT